MSDDYQRCLDWITRDYETNEHWKAIGKEVFLFANGDSAFARHRLAHVLRESFRSDSGEEREPVKVNHWGENFTHIVTTEVMPPGIHVSSFVYVDWIRLADYVLLAAASSWDRLEEENQHRKEMQEVALKGFETRAVIGHIYDYLDKHSKATNERITAALKKEKIDVKAVQIKLARKSHDAAADIEHPEAAEVPPEAPQMIERYKPLYF